MHSGNAGAAVPVPIRCLHFAELAGLIGDYAAVNILGRHRLLVALATPRDVGRAMANAFDPEGMAKQARDEAAKRRGEVMFRMRRSYYSFSVSRELAGKSRTAIKRSNELLAKVGLPSLYRDRLARSSD